MVELAAAVGGALLTACFVSVGSISYRGGQSRDDLVRNTTAVKRLIVDLLRAICKQTSNSLDDRAVDLLEQQLFPKLN